MVIEEWWLYQSSHGIGVEVYHQMGIFDSLGALASSIVAAIVMLIFAIVSFFITVFIVQVGAGIAGYSPSGDFVVLAAAILAASAIIAGASPMSGLSGISDPGR